MITIRPASTSIHGFLLRSLCLCLLSLFAGSASATPCLGVRTGTPSNPLFQWHRIYQAGVSWQLPNAVPTSTGYFHTFLYAQDVADDLNDAMSAWRECANVPVDAAAPVATPAGNYTVVWNDNSQMAFPGSSTMETDLGAVDGDSYAIIDYSQTTINKNLHTATTNYYWSECTSCDHGAGWQDMDLPTSFTHEYGHALGFLDYSVPGWYVMYEETGESVRMLAECEKESEFKLYDCPMAAALFVNHGLFADTAYCETYNESGTDSIGLYGFNGSGSYPNGGTSLRQFVAAGGTSQLVRYQATGIGGYDYYEWREHSGMAQEISTGPFGSSARPSDYYTRLAGGSEIDSLTWVENSSAADDIVFHPTPPSESDCADIIVYSFADSLADPVYQQIVTDAPALRVRKLLAPSSWFTGPDHSAQACKNAIVGVVNANAAWNSYCSGGSCHHYPTAPGPEVYIVGDSWLMTHEGPLGQVINDGPVGIGTVTQSEWQFACTGNCRSDMLIYDLNNDGVPDGPLSRVPAWSVAQARKATWAAQDVNRNRNVETGSHVALLAGKMWGDPYSSEALLDSVKLQYRNIQFADDVMLKETSYPPVGDPSTAFDARFNVFSSQVAAGLREVFGYGGMTGTGVVPGFFINGLTPYAGSRLGTKTRLVAWMPACLLHASWMSGYDSYNSASRNLMFGDSTKTMIAASVAQMDIGWFKYHQRMGKLLANAREAAGAVGGRKSVARIAYDAVVAAIAEGGDMAQHALSLSTWGSYVLVGRGKVPYPVSDLTAGAGRTSAACAWTEPEQDVGTADAYEIRYQAYTPLTEANFASGTLYATPPSPGAGGTEHCIEKSSLGSCRAYYFAIRTQKDGMWSPISNVASASTMCSGSVVASCDEMGLMAGGGGGEEGLRRQSTTTSSVGGSRGAGEQSPLSSAEENSLFSGSANAMTDLWKVSGDRGPSEGKYLIRLREVGDDTAEIDQVSLGFVDRSPGLESYAGSDGVFVGTTGPVESVRDGDGRSLAELADGVVGSGYVATKGGQLLVGLGTDPGTAALILSTRGPSTEAVVDSSGIYVQVPDPKVSWRTIATFHPRREVDTYAIDVTGQSQVRLACLGPYQVQGVRRMSVSKKVTPSPLNVAAAKHSRLGDVADAIAKEGGATAILQPGDSLSLAFTAEPTQTGMTRDCFLQAKGMYQRSNSVSDRSSDMGLESVRPQTWVFALSAAHPNPSNGRVTFGYTLARATTATLRLYNVAGRLVRTVVQEHQDAGPHEVLWDGKDDKGARSPAGVYFYRLQADSWSSERKLVVIQR